jgi:hypothetical protein
MTTLSVQANTPAEVVAAVAAYFSDQAATLERRAGLTTGAQKKALVERATYARQQAMVWQDMGVSPSGPALALTPDDMTKDERSVLVYAESVTVDYGGLMEADRMNAEDFAGLDKLAVLGFLTWGRIPAALLGQHDLTRTKPTHWCKLTESGWALAHQCRVRLADRVGPYAKSVHDLVAERAAR